jgi:hypothetical protein
LSQYQDDILRPVAFYSRKLTPAEINYEIHNKELLAIIVCLYQWRSLFLINNLQIEIRTDHQNLLYYTSSRRLNRRQARWAIFLTDFDFKIVYVEGKKNEHPDALSCQKNYQLHTEDPHCKNQQQVLLKTDQCLISTNLIEDIQSINEIKKEQTED